MIHWMFTTLGDSAMFVLCNVVIVAGIILAFLALHWTVESLTE